MSTYILVVDDEPDVEHLFRQQFRRDIRSGRFVMEFAASAPEALERAKMIADPMLILILSDINMPGMSARGWQTLLNWPFRRCPARRWTRC
jgi:CheY-like chemotaxis protein